MWCPGTTNKVSFLVEELRLLDEENVDTSGLDLWNVSTQICFEKILSTNETDA